VTPHDHDETPPTEGDLEIVRLIRERDGMGLRLLLQRHGGNVEGALRVWFRGHLKSTDIDEVVSAASFRVWQSIHTYAQDKGSLRAWFLVICRNLGRDLLRRRNPVRHEAFDENVDPRLANSGERTDGPPQRLVQVLRECVAALPKLQKAVVEADLRCDGTANAAELAKKLETTPNSIYVTRSHARRALREALAKRGYHFEGTTLADAPRPEPGADPQTKSRPKPQSNA
jgi:RNA polymerase sigma factor (sigma-70 family)